MSANRKYEESPAYHEKLSKFLELKEARKAKQEAQDVATLKQRHDDIAASFHERCQRVRQWNAESKRRHAEDRNLFSSRRQHEAELQRQHEERLARIRSIHHDSVVMESQAGIASLEANIRRLGLDEAKTVTGPTSNAKQPTIDPLAANHATVAEIRRRKNVDVAARREKLQRQYVAQQQQMLASQDVVHKQMIDGVIAKSAAALAADRDASLAARRQRVVQTWEAQLSHVLHEGEKARRLAAFHRHDEAFAVVAAKQRVAANEAFDQVRSVRREEEEALHAKKHAAHMEYFGTLVREVVSLATEVASRNYVRLADGTVLRRLNPPTPAEWRDMKDAHLSVTAIQDAIATKREAAARQVALSNASPRNKRTSSINMGAFGGSLTLPSTPPMFGSGAGSPTSSAASIMDLMNAPPPTLFPVPDDADAEAAEVALESLVALDGKRMSDVVENAVRAVYGESRASLDAAHRAKCSELIAHAQTKSAASGAWWTSVLNDLPPAAMFVLGDPLSGVKLLGDLRYVSEGVEQDSLLTPEKLLAAAAASKVPSQPQASAAATEGLNAASASSPSPPGGKAAPSPSKAAPPPKSSPAGGAPRPSDVAPPPPLLPGSGSGANGDDGGASIALSPSVLAATLAKLVVKHHRKQIEALVKKDNASGYPPSLVLVDFPVDDETFLSEFNGCVEREVEEDEKSWAPAKLILGQDSTSQHHGGGGVGTHRSSLAGGQGGTNPNTPHGSIANQGQPALLSPPHSNHGGSVHHESPGGRHHAPPAFSAAAGKHQAALIAMQASAMFYPAVRISAVSLTLAFPNLVERYQSATRHSASGTWHHATWFPLPATPAVFSDAAGLGASQILPKTYGASTVDTAQPPWSGMSASQIDEYVTSKGAAWTSTVSHWVRVMGSAHGKPPLPPASSAALGNSMGSTYGSAVTSSVAPPPAVAAPRHTRVLHFLSEIPVDDMSPLDPHDVVAQLLAQLTRSTSQRDARNESCLVAPLLAPMSLATMSIPETSFEELLQVHRRYEREVRHWMVDDVIAASQTRSATFAEAFAAEGSGTARAAPDGDDGVTARKEKSKSAAAVGRLPSAIAQRLDDSKEALRMALRALRELETESARCLHHSYLHVLQILNTDAYSSTAATFQARLRDQPSASGVVGPISETKQDQLFWELCDEEMSRLRHTTGGSIGLLSTTVRQLQFLQLRTLIDVVQLLSEQVTMLVVGSLLEAYKRRRSDDEATATAVPASESSSSWATSTAEQICASCFATTWRFHSVDDTLLQNLLTSVHENGVLLQDTIWHLCQQMAADAQRNVASALRAVTRCGLEDSVAGEIADALWTDTESYALGAIVAQLANLVLLGSGASQNSPRDDAQGKPQFVGRLTQSVCSVMMKHESMRKQLSLGSASWLSYLFQEASKLRRALDRFPTILRPSTFDELRKTEVDASITDATQRSATRSLCISSGQLEHLLSAFASVRWHYGKADAGLTGAATLMVDRSGFAHGILAAQASTLHLHLASPVLEEIVAPLLQLTCSAETKEWVGSLTGESHRALFLPAWWVASGKWCATATNECVAGHCFTLDALHEMFDELGVDELDLAVWLAQMVTGATDARFLTPDGARFFGLDASRIAQPNVLQSRTLMEDVDAIRRKTDSRNTTAVPLHKLRWWPFFPSLVSNVALMEARMAQVLAELNVLLHTTCDIDRRTGLLVPVNGAEEGASDIAYFRIARWVLATAAPSGPSAVLEMAFAVAASLRGSLLSKMDEVRPQPTTVPHSKASIAVHIVASVLRAVYPLWTEDNLRLFVLLTMPAKKKSLVPSSNGDEEEEWTVPLSTRYVEISFAALNASHLGTLWVAKYGHQITVPRKEPLFL